MHEHCPVCGLLYEREHGYFLGAMYVAFFIAMPFLLVLTLVLWLLTRWQTQVIFTVASAILAVLMPHVFRYSRVIWMHLDRAIDPPRD